MVPFVDGRPGRRRRAVTAVCGRTPLAAAGPATAPRARPLSRGNRPGLPRGRSARRLPGALRAGPRAGLPTRPRPLALTPRSRGRAPRNGRLRSNAPRLARTVGQASRLSVDGGVLRRGGFLRTLRIIAVEGHFPGRGGAVRRPHLLRPELLGRQLGRRALRPRAALLRLGPSLRAAPPPGPGLVAPGFARRLLGRRGGDGEEGLSLGDLR